MAGADEPGTLAGFFNMKPMMLSNQPRKPDLNSLKQ